MKWKLLYEDKKDDEMYRHCDQQIRKTQQNVNT